MSTNTHTDHQILTYMLLVIPTDESDAHRIRPYFNNKLFCTQVADDGEFVEVSLRWLGEPSAPCVFYTQSLHNHVLVGAATQEFVEAAQKKLGMNFEHLLLHK